MAMNNERFKLTGYEYFASSEVDWLPMDTEELYRYNLKNNRKLLEEHSWLDTPISYKFNSNGFRSIEFTDNNAIAFLGCSFTIGVGLPQQNIFPEIVASSLNLKCYNLGIGGASADTCFRLAYYWLSKIKPKIVVCMAPSLHRLETIKNTEFYHHRPSQAKDADDVILSEEYCYLNQQKNILGIRNICKDLGIKILDYKLERDFIQVPNDLARDLSHLGVKSHLATAQMILKSI